jgi:antitoxin component YwqK of YwqJK toxin-antitoxin module
LVYRKGIETPFTGRIIDRFESGEIKMDSSYMEGQPHGMQVRYYDNGQPALEASFDQGRLSGIKSRWWENGLIREEEYWSEGKYRGRRLWDESGRLTKEEMLP